MTEQPFPKPSSVLPPDQDHRNQAVDPAVSVLLRAPAGSGKTGVLLLRYLRCLLTVDQPEQVIAITFTNKAAGEIKERVLAALAAVAAQPGNAFDQAVAEAVRAVLQKDRECNWQLLENSARLRIVTFDSFCGSLTRRLPLLSGLGATRPLSDPEVAYGNAIMALFRQLDEPSCSAELRGALSRLLAYGSNRIETLRPLLAALLAKRDQWLEDILSGDIEQMEQALAAEVKHRYQPLLAQLRKWQPQTLLQAFIEASGYVEDLAWAAELDSQLADTAAQLPLLQRLANQLLSGKGELYKPGSLHFAKFTKAVPATAQLKAWLKDREEGGDYPALSALFAELAALPEPTLPEGSRQLVEDFRCALRYLVAHLRLEFEHQGGVDFGEIAQRAIFALRNGSDSDHHGPQEVSDALLVEDRIGHILVDEMQDTSVSQIQLLRYLCQDWQEGDGRSVFFCGDLQQSIYAFRGSLVELFDDLSQQARFANRPLLQLQLRANFRSAAALVNWVNQTYGQLARDWGREAIPALPQRDIAGALHVHAWTQAQKITAKRQAQSAEAGEIVSIIQRRQAEDARLGRQSSIAVLVRSRSHLAAIVPALKQAGIAFSGQDIDALAQTPAVMDYCALLRSLWHEADDVAWARLLRAPFVGLGWEDIRRLRQRGGLLRDAVLAGAESDLGPALSADGGQRLTRLAELIGWLEDQPMSRDLRWALRTAWHLLDGPACVSETEYRDVEQVLALLDQYAPAGLLEDVAAFEAALERLFATPPSSSVELMTVHKSKGLEFDVVILPGLGSRGRNEDSPLLVWRHLRGHMIFAPKPQHSDDAASRLYHFIEGQRRAALAEELDRQLYVALTRAKAELHLFGLASEDKNGELKPESASFLNRLWPALANHFADAPRFEQSDPQSAGRVPLGARMVAPQRQLHGTVTPRSASVSALQQAQRFSENAVLEDNIEERAMGIVFHELMERLGRGDYQPLLQDRVLLGQRIAQRLRHHCHPEPGLEQSVARVVSLLDNTLACPRGQWILSSYQWQGNEQTLRRWVGGQWQTLILDRVFIERTTEGDKCWIIDYKTAAAKENRTQFFAAQAARYNEKMRLYRDALAATGIDCAIVAALYFPAHQHLLVLP